MSDHEERYNAGIIETTDGKPPVHFDAPAPNPELGPDGQHKSYWVLSAAERNKGWVRPYRDAYRHATCGKVTTMGRALSETYAAKPDFYGATMCVHCGRHFPVGANGEFTWLEMDGAEGEKVGT